jgi:hypothetical protein
VSLLPGIIGTTAGKVMHATATTIINITKNFIAHLLWCNGARYGLVPRQSEGVCLACQETVIKAGFYGEKRRVSNIAEFLVSLAEYRDYGCDFRLTRGVSGMVPVCLVNEEPYIAIDPMELVCMGYEDSHAMISHHDREWRVPEDQRQALELNKRAFIKLVRAVYAVECCDPKLRAAVLAACGLEGNT